MSGDVAMNPSDSGRPQSAGRTRALLLTSASLGAFALNSILCRLALEPGSIDAASFTMVRLLSGSAMLALLAWPKVRSVERGSRSIAGGLALFVYATCFSFAYLRLPTGIGALILFGCVQLTMIGVATWRGLRPSTMEWVGLLVALPGLVYLTLPHGGHNVSTSVWALLLPSLSMAASGIAWGVYSLLGDGADPLVATARNFARSLWFVPALAFGSWLFSNFHITVSGAAYAVASGALTSGCGYALWYAALVLISPTRAALVQLLVPVLAALGGVVLLSEPLSRRLLIGTATILGGVGLAIVAGRARRSRAEPSLTPVTRQ